MRLCVLLYTLILPLTLHGETEKNPLDIRLISATQSITQGSEFWLGFHLRHPAGAHTYWKHPGIVGLATQVEWDLPAGFSAGLIQWPAPEMVTMAVYQAQGYHDETLLLIPFKSPPNLTESTVTLTAKVSWMCCAKSCHPAAKVPFSITLPVAATATPDPVNSQLFAKFRALVPKPDPSWRTTVARAKNEIILTIQPPATAPSTDSTTGIHFFTADGQVDSNRPQQIERLPNQAIRLTLAVSETAPADSPTLPGVVVFPAGWPIAGQPFHLEIEPTY